LTDIKPLGPLLIWRGQRLSTPGLIQEPDLPPSKDKPSFVLGNLQQLEYSP
jgi:hypothetical protein